MSLDSNDVFPIYRSSDGTNRKATISALLAMGSGPTNSTVNFTGSQGITYPGNTSFTLNQANDVTIDIAGPDLTNYLEKPNTDGVYLITVSSGVVTYTTSTALQPGEAATPAEGALAVSALQPGADNTELTNNAGYITAGDIPALDYVPLGSWAALPAV